MSILVILLTHVQRQNEPDQISKEAAESQKDPTLPVWNLVLLHVETCPDRME